MMFLKIIIKVFTKYLYEFYIEHLPQQLLNESFTNRWFIYHKKSRQLGQFNLSKLPALLSKYSFLSLLISIAVLSDA
ncbi:MAG: hypothetical protein DUD34_09955 [Lactobacillus sp.]|nr:MAG: hypothetical protein DUD34_09955 [Lactobacillus sp.]